MLDPTMKEWVLAASGGVRLVGLLRGRTLSPVFELAVVYEMVHSGSKMPPQLRAAVHSVAAPFGYPSIEALELPDGTLTYPVQRLALAEQNALRKAIEGYEALIAKERSGLVIASGLNDQASKLNS